jgi:hypothetical protein
VRRGDERKARSGIVCYTRLHRGGCFCADRGGLLLLLLLWVQLHSLTLEADLSYLSWCCLLT